MADDAKDIPVKVDADYFTSDAIKSLRLPVLSDEVAHEVALSVDSVLSREKRESAALVDALAVGRERAFSHLFKLTAHQTLDVNRFSWPASLFIPKNANPRDYWISPAPDDHRYALEWTSPVDAGANRASRLDGTLACHGQLHNETPRTTQSAEAGIGVLYKPPMSLGVIDLQPHVACTGTLRTFLEYFPQLSAGAVEVKANLLLAAWQVIPGGFDLVGWKLFDVASTGRADQSHGAVEQHFSHLFPGDQTLSAPFVVQRGRTYLLGVVARITVTSTLTTNTGGTLPTFSGDKLKVWGLMNCVVPQIDVFTKRIDIP